MRLFEIINNILDSILHFFGDLFCNGIFGIVNCINFLLSPIAFVLFWILLGIRTVVFYVLKISWLVLPILVMGFVCYSEMQSAKFSWTVTFISTRAGLCLVLVLLSKFTCKFINFILSIISKYLVWVFTGGYFGVVELVDKMGPKGIMLGENMKKLFSDRASWEVLHDFPESLSYKQYEYFRKYMTKREMKDYEEYAQERNDRTLREKKQMNDDWAKNHKESFF